MSSDFLTQASILASDIGSKTEFRHHPARMVGLFVLCLQILVGIANLSSAQPQDRMLGLGGMVGRTAGISAKLYIASDSTGIEPIDVRAIDFSMSWAADDIVLWTVHVLTHRKIPNSPLSFFLGPGATVGMRDSQLFWGLSSNLGLFFEKQRFEVFLQMTPRLVIVPELLGEFGSAVGLRYYL